MLPPVEIYIPDGGTVAEAWSNVTHLAVGAHPDDIEFMAFHGIQSCYDRETPAFAAIVCADGARAPRAGDFAEMGAEDLVARRAAEQQRAADLGRYALLARFGHTSPDVRAGALAVRAALRSVLSLAHPEIIYTHSPLDRHPTHAAVARLVVETLRELPTENSPRHLYGCEVWGGLDWIPEHYKVQLDVSRHQELAAALIAVYESQVKSEKRYDRAVPGRWQANATFAEWDAGDKMRFAALAVDLTPVLHGADPLPAYVQRLLADHREESLRRLTGV